MQKKKIVSFICVAIIAGTLLYVGCADAQGINLGIDDVHKAGETAGFARANETTLASTVGRIVRVFLSLVGITFTVLMLYGGYLWMTARGEESQITKAKDVIRASIIGLIIALGAFSISNFVVDAILSSTEGPTVGS